MTEVAETVEMETETEMVVVVPLTMTTNQTTKERLQSQWGQRWEFLVPLLLLCLLFGMCEGIDMETTKSVVSPP